MLTTMMVIAGCAAEASAEAPTARIAWDATRQTVDGFGASSAWYTRRVGQLPDDQREAFFRFVFDETEGLGLSILRLRIEPRPYDQATKRYDWSHKKIASALPFYREAAKWDPLVLASPWSPPAWMKQNEQLKQGGYLKPAMAEDYAAYLSAWVRGLEEQTGLAVDVLSVQNEPGVKPWESLEWKREDLVHFVGHALAERLKADEVDVKVLAAEWTGWDDQWLNAMLDDPAAAARLDIAGAHLYWNGFKNIRPFPRVAEAGLPLWMTEHYYEGQTDSPIHAGLINARHVHEVFTEAEGNAYLFWWLFAVADKGYNQSLIEVGGSDETGFKPKKHAYAFANFSRFVRPGFVRLAVSDPQPVDGVFVTAFRHPDDGRFAIVLNNLTEAEQTIDLQLVGFDVASVQPHRTSADENLAPLEPLAVDAGTVQLDLPARSIITLTRGE